MAWRCSGATNRELIDNMYRAGLIKSERVRDAMMSVDRAHYAPHFPYKDRPQSIGHAATISAPHMHASACEQLLPYLQPGACVLDIGSGSGYLTHVLAELVAPGGTVVGVEHISALAELGRENMGKSGEGRELLEKGAAEFVVGDGRRGWIGVGGGVEGGMKGWDAIHVGAAAKELHPELVEQLAQPGGMFIPVETGDGERAQFIYLVEKSRDGKVETRKLFGVQYVPLTDAPSKG